jgi:pyruvate dehydrogenase E2 component (dihydrolipoamide acetyltransferase)
MSKFKMPSLGADMDAGTLVEWKMKSGDPVKRGDIIAAVETAKGVIEIECFEDGILDQIFFQAGQEVPVEQVLATISSGRISTKPAARPKPPSVKAEKILRGGKPARSCRAGTEGRKAASCQRLPAAR